VIGLCGRFALADSKPDIARIAPGPISVTAKPISHFERFRNGSRLVDKLAFRGGLVLSSSSPNFGGWSGFILGDDGKSFLSISDSGVWMKGKLTYDGSRPSGMENVVLGPLTNSTGAALGPMGSERDAESVTLESGNLDRGRVLVGFEGRDRIDRYDLSPDGLSAECGTVTLPNGARKIQVNRGLEAIGVLKGGAYKGSLIAFAERLLDKSGNHTGWLWTSMGPKAVHLKNIGGYDITDLSSLDDGTVFVLERRFNWLEGLKIRVRRINPEELQPGQTAVGDILLEADLNDDIDNMEGISATRLDDGQVVLTMISDDNFNHILQRTVLLQFAVRSSEQAKTRLGD
jgi:hypothetical protein